MQKDNITCVHECGFRTNVGKLPLYSTTSKYIGPAHIDQTLIAVIRYEERKFSQWDLNFAHLEVDTHQFHK